MALESATYIAQLNNANPSSTDVVSQADDHLRLIKSVLKNTFPNLDQPVTATPAAINQPIPSGLISLWSGSIASIPTGWKLCDGNNGTPNLTDRFVIGAGNTYAVGATGGSATQTLSSSNIPAHTHSISGTVDSAGAHTHTITDPGHYHSLSPNFLSSGYTTGGAVGTGIGVGGNNTSTATTGISINSGGAHTHTFSGASGSTGSGTAFSILPPYYALAYIMKS